MNLRGGALRIGISGVPTHLSILASSLQPWKSERCPEVGSSRRRAKRGRQDLAVLEGQIDVATEGSTRTTNRRDRRSPLKLAIIAGPPGCPSTQKPTSL